MGRYMPQQELERVVEYEQRTLAERLALTARDFSQDARDAGYAPTLNLALSAKGGFPEIEQQIFERLGYAAEDYSRVERICGSP